MSKTKQLIQKYINENKTLSIVESITGGGLAYKLTSINNSSKVIKASEVLYHDEAKKINYDIEKQNIYSTLTTEKLTRHLLKKYNTNIALAVVGIAGPSNPSNDMNIGDVIFTISSKEKTKNYRFHFSGSRTSIRKKAIKQIIKELFTF